MATINASVWLLIKEHADPQRVFDQYVTVYRESDRALYSWLLLYYSVQASHLDLVREMLDEERLSTKLGISKRTNLLESENLLVALNEAVRKADVSMADLIVSAHPILVVQTGYVFSTHMHTLFESSPLELAICMDHLDVLKVLVKSYNWKPLGIDRKTLLHFATKYTAPKCFEFLVSLPPCVEQINLKDEEDLTPLLCAAMHQPQTIPKLLEHGADVLVKHGQNDDNALHDLCNGCMRTSQTRLGEGDPCPNLNFGRRSRPIFSRSDQLYIPANFTKLAKLLVSKGLNVNDPTPPLKKFCQNIRRKLQDLLGDEQVTATFKEAISYLSSISNADVVDECLLILCHQLMFICTQLRRSSDYDNIVRHIDLMEFIRDCVYILLENGAKPNCTESVEVGEKRLRGLQFLIPFSLPCGKHLKSLIEVECHKPQTTGNLNTYNSPSDVVLVALMVLFPVQIEEPEIHARGMGIILEIFQTLSRLGSKCNQLLQLFLALCVDPKKHIRFLEAYLHYQNQSDYHEVVSYLLELSRQHTEFAETQNELGPFLACMFSLKNLLRRDIVGYLGGGKCTDKVDGLPLPNILKEYLLDFWRADTN